MILAIDLAAVCCGDVVDLSRAPGSILNEGSRRPPRGSTRYLVDRRVGIRATWPFQLLSISEICLYAVGGKKSCTKSCPRVLKRWGTKTLKQPRLGYAMQWSLFLYSASYSTKTYKSDTGFLFDRR